MKKLFTIFALVICLTSLKAQYVTVTDTAFVNWLQANIPSAMIGNQMDTTSLAVTTRTNIELTSGYTADISSIKYFISQLL